MSLFPVVPTWEQLSAFPTRIWNLWPEETLKSLKILSCRKPSHVIMQIDPTHYSEIIYVHYVFMRNELFQFLNTVVYFFHTTPSSLIIPIWMHYSEFSLLATKWVRESDNHWIQIKPSVFAEHMAASRFFYDWMIELKSDLLTLFIFSRRDGEFVISSLSKLLRGNLTNLTKHTSQGVHP